MHGDHLPLISVIIVALNEENYLQMLLDDLIRQTYPRQKREFILVDSISKDNTRNLMENFARKHEKENIKILTNPGVIQATGWNLGITAAKGEVIMRLDAHCRLPIDYFESCIKFLLKGEQIVGGPVISLSSVNRPWVKLINLIEKSRFGASPASFRNFGSPKYVDSLAFAAYNKKVFSKVGLFNEQLKRSEDNEIHYRMRKAGFRFYFNPKIYSFRISRSKLNGLLKQYFGNAFWIGSTFWIAPGVLSYRYIIPSLFLLNIIIALILLLNKSYYYLLLLSISYLLVALFFSLKNLSALKAREKPLVLMMPILFLILHLTYGMGMLLGLVKATIYKIRTKLKMKD